VAHLSARHDHARLCPSQVRSQQPTLGTTLQQGDKVSADDQVGWVCEICIRTGPVGEHHYKLIVVPM